MLMLFHHARGPGYKFVLLFHMAIFFIASGYLYQRVTNVQSFINFCMKKIKGLWIPYFFYMSIFTIFNNVFLVLGIYSDNANLISQLGEDRYIGTHIHFGLKDIVVNLLKIFLFHGSSEIGGALWFLQTLFCVIVLYALCDFLIEILFMKNRNFSQFLISIVLLIIGYICSVRGISAGGLARAASSYPLIFIGNVFSEYEIMDKIIRVEKGKAQPLITFLFLSVILSRLSRYGTIGIDTNHIVNPIFFITASISGWIMIYCLSVLCVHYCPKKIQCYLAYISRKSVHIVALHLLCFKLVNLIAVFVTKQDYGMIAAFPVLISTGIWWIVYMFFGLGASLLANWGFCKIKYNLHIIRCKRG